MCVPCTPAWLTPTLHRLSDEAAARHEELGVSKTQVSELAGKLATREAELSATTTQLEEKTTALAWVTDEKHKLEVRRASQGVCENRHDLMES